MSDWNFESNEYDDSFHHYMEVQLENIGCPVDSNLSPHDDSESGPFPSSQNQSDQNTFQLFNIQQNSGQQSFDNNSPIHRKGVPLTEQGKKLKEMVRYIMQEKNQKDYVNYLKSKLKDLAILGINITYDESRCFNSVYNRYGQNGIDRVNFLSAIETLLNNDHGISCFNNSH